MVVCSCSALSRWQSSVAAAAAPLAEVWSLTRWTSERQALKRGRPVSAAASSLPVVLLVDTEAELQLVRLVQLLRLRFSPSGKEEQTGGPPVGTERGISRCMAVASGELLIVHNAVKSRHHSEAQA